MSIEYVESGLKECNVDGKALFWDGVNLLYLFAVFDFAILDNFSFIFAGVIVLATLPGP